MPLSDIVNVVITRQTQTVTEAGFGIPMILGTNVKFVDPIKFYSDLDEVFLDFKPYEKEYICAQDIFAQEIAPTQIAIGRRQVNTVNVQVETAMTGKTYTVNANGQIASFTSSSAYTYSEVNLDEDLVPENRIAVALNGVGLGNVTAIIDFNDDFVTGNNIQPVVNGVSLPTPVPFTTDQPTTIALVATKISTAAGTPVATVTGARQITVVFGASGTNSVDSFNVTGGASQTTYLIAQGGFVFTSDTESTMQLIANSIVSTYPTFTAVVSGLDGRTLTVQGPVNTSAVINSFVVTGGTDQATATITSLPQSVSKVTVASGIVSAVNSISGYPLTAASLGSGLFSLTTTTPGVAFTLSVGTDIINPNEARVVVTQVIPSTTYRVTINGRNFNYLTPVDIQTADQIATAFVTMINDVATTVTAANNNDGTFQIDSNVAENSFSLSVSESILSIEQGLIVQPLVAANPVATDLTNINNSNDTWYALISLDRTVQTVKDIALWTETHIKIFGTASNDPKIINLSVSSDTGVNASIAAWASQNGLIRTFVMYHQDADTDFPEAAWFGRVLPLEPGSETWKFKTLANVVASNLTTTQQNNALDKNCNIYTYVAGVNITSNGTMAQGEFIDIIRGVDWLRSRIQEFVYSILVQNPKVPYTDAGITSVQAEVMRALALGVSNEFLTNDPAPIVTVPRSADVSPTDKANRILRNIKFQATLAGAIHAVRITGNLSL